MIKQTKQQTEFVKKLHTMGKQAGFTLVELMIAIILGLLVIAAALAVFIGGQRALNVQQGMGSIQESAVFGLNQLTYFVRHANLNTTTDQKVNLNAVGSGIVFNENNFPASATSQIKAEVSQSKGGVLNNSDVLTIQFMPSYDRSNRANFISTMTDCEGRDIRFSSKNVDSQYVSVMRFYVDKMPDSQQNASGTRYALYCDASYYDAANKSSVSIDNIGGQVTNNSGGIASIPAKSIKEFAVVMIPDVEAFKVRLGVKRIEEDPITKEKKISYKYMPINEYTDATQNVVSVELGILVRSNANVGADSNIEATKTYNVAGIPVKMTTDNSGTKYLREAFSQVVALRNAQGK